MPEDPASSRRWLTYTEIAEALRLPSAKAGEAKARRAKWERKLGNDGFARVAVPLSVLEEPHPLRRASEAPTKAPQEGPAINAVLAELRAAHEQALAALRTSHEETTGELRRRAEVAERRLTTAETEIAVERQRREVAEQEAARLRAEAERASKERAELTAALSAALQPWWRRLLGPR